MATYFGNGNGRQPFDWLHVVKSDQFIYRFLVDLLFDQMGTSDLDLLNRIQNNLVTAALDQEQGSGGSPGELTPGSFAERMAERYGNDFNRTSVSKAATICQMILFDRQHGPERDNKPKALRRHWYAWFKTRFAQPFARQLGDYTISRSGVTVYNDLAWSQRLSQVYAWFVDNAEYWQEPVCPNCGTVGRLELRDYFDDQEPDAYRCNNCGWHGSRQEPIKRTCTYRDLWVEDASRMMARTGAELFKGINLIVAVEKDSLFEDFKGAAKALGATAVISGKGKSSKAAIEKLLRDHFDWSDEIRYDWNGKPRPPVFSADRPIHVIHVSDHDFDGQAVIGPTFGEQLRRYTPHVREARVGIKPEDLTVKGYDPADVMYSVKLSNSGYVGWAENNALFLAECADCGHQAVTKGSVDYSDERYQGSWPNACPECGGPFMTIVVNKKDLPKGSDRDIDIAYGLEVEAMTSADYRDLLVKALLTILDFDYIVERLRAETLAYDQYAAERLRDNALEDNADYQQLLADYQDLERRKQRFENAVLDSIWRITARQADAYPHQGDDPDVTDYSDHVVRGEWGPWQPFSKDERTAMLVEDFENPDHSTHDLIAAWQQEDPEDYDTEDWDYINTTGWND